MLIEYFVANDSVVAFGISRDRLQAKVLPLSEQTLHHRVRLLRDLWATPRGAWQAGLPVARALYGQLLYPLREMVTAESKRLVIVPHGVLAQVPFAALRSGAPDKFIVEQYAVVHAPSAAAFVASRTVQGRRRANAMSGTAFAPFIVDLPASGAEVSAFAASVPRSRTRVGVAATEAALREAVRGDGIVHVATHGVMNAHNPMFSRIELGRASENVMTRHDDDGRLEVREVLHLDVRSSLLFLSGCETGAFDAWLDSPTRGAGDLSLSQAFLSAGAGNVISTLWRIDDESAAGLARTFYHKLRVSSAADALASAQREFSRHATFGNPYYWAAYVLSGEGRFTLDPQKPAMSSVY